MGQNLSRMDPPRTASFNGNRSCAGVQKNERTSSATGNAASNATKIARQDWENSEAGEGIHTLAPALAKSGSPPGAPPAPDSRPPQGGRPDDRPPMQNRPNLCTHPARHFIRAP